MVGLVGHSQRKRGANGQPTDSPYLPHPALGFDSTGNNRCTRVPSPVWFGVEARISPSGLEA